MNKKPLVVLGLAALLAARGFAASVGQEPLGFLKISCPGSSDTIVSLPLNRPTVFVGAATAATVTANAVATLTFSGSPFTASAYKYAAGTQSNTYFAFIAGGAKEGSYYTIVANTANTLTIDLNGDSIAAIASAVTVKIIPYWTLGTVFPGGSGVTASDGFTAATQVLLPDTTGVGTNLAAAAIYYYASASGSWVKSGSAGSANDTVLYPDTYFTVRNNTAAATSFTLAGAVAVHKLAVPLATSSSTRQDNPVAIARPVSVTLDASGLVSSGAFTASSGFAVGDQLYVFDNTAAQLRKAASRIYTYANGAWRRSGVSGDSGADSIFTPGAGVLIRKAKTSLGSSATWIDPLPISY